MSHTVTGRMGVETRCQTETTTSHGANCLSGGVGGWQTPEFLALPVGSKPWKEDQGDIDDNGGHLYNWVKMLYEEGNEPRAVLTQRTEDTILIVSSLSPPYVQHKFLLPPKQSWFVIILSPRFFFLRNKGSPPPK